MAHPINDPRVFETRDIPPPLVLHLIAQPQHLLYS